MYCTEYEGVNLVATHKTVSCNSWAISDC